jgi:hypothetical protein
MLAVIQFRPFRFPVCYLKKHKLKHRKLKFNLLVCMGVKLGLSSTEEHIEQTDASGWPKRGA